MTRNASPFRRTAKPVAVPRGAEFTSARTRSDATDGRAMLMAMLPMVAPTAIRRADPSCRIAVGPHHEQHACQRLRRAGKGVLSKSLGVPRRCVKRSHGEGRLPDWTIRDLMKRWERLGIPFPGDAGRPPPPVPAAPVASVPGLVCGHSQASLVKRRQVCRRGSS